MRSFAKINPRDMAKSLSFTDVGYSCKSRIFNVANMFLTIFAKVSEFTV